MSDSTLFDPTAGQFFSTVSEPKSWTKRYRQNHPTLDENGQAKDPLYATYFSKEFIDSILNQPRPADSPCVGLRIYRGTDAQQKPHTILVGVDSQGNDILYATTALGTPDSDDVMVGDYGKNCPNECGSIESELMAD